MRRRLAVLASVFRNPALRRVAGAFLAFSIGEWATWVAVIVYAYGRGGAAEAGFVAFIQLVPSVVMAPAAGTLGDRFSRKRVLLTAYVLQTGAMAAAALALATGAPAPVVYALATLTATAITMTRPVQSALLPDVATTPDQLTAANVASGTIEGAGTLLGPALAGVLTAVGGPALVFAVSSVGLFLATLSILPLARRDIRSRARGRSRRRRAARPHALARVHRDRLGSAAPRHRGGLRCGVPADGRPRHLLRRARARRLRAGRRRGRVRRGSDGVGPARGRDPGGLPRRTGSSRSADPRRGDGLRRSRGPGRSQPAGRAGARPARHRRHWLGVRVHRHPDDDPAHRRRRGDESCLRRLRGADAGCDGRRCTGRPGSHPRAGNDRRVPRRRAVRGARRGPCRPFTPARRSNLGLPPRGAAPASLEPDVRAAFGTGPRVADAFDASRVIRSRRR